MMRRRRRSAGRHRQPRFVACVAVVAVIAALASAATAGAVPAPRPPQQAVAVVKAGVVWYDNGVVRLIGRGGGAGCWLARGGRFFGDRHR